MAEAEDVERQLEIARLAVLKARACWAEWVAPPPDFECDLSDEEYLRRAEVERPAGRAEQELFKALDVIRTQFLGYPPPAAPSEGDGDE